MPCCNRRGCVDRFRDSLTGPQLMAILAHHGACGGCGNDVTDNPKFADDQGMTPYCPACYEETWPSGKGGPFERGKPRVMLKLV